MREKKNRKNTGIKIILVLSPCIVPGVQHTKLNCKIQLLICGVDAAINEHLTPCPTNFSIIACVSKNYYLFQHCARYDILKYYTVFVFAIVIIKTPKIIKGGRLNFVYKYRKYLFCFVYNLHHECDSWFYGKGLRKSLIPQGLIRSMNVFTIQTRFLNV